MSALVKFGLPAALGTGVAGAGGYYLVSDRETIGSALTSSLKDFQKVLSSRGDSEWKEWKEVYGASQEKINSVTKDSLPQWCENTLKLSKKDKNYDLASKWCVVNTRSFKDELASKGIQVLTEAASDGKWQKAWKHHNSKKSENNSLAITDTTVVASTVTESNGSTPMHKWCTDRYSSPMYKLNAESEMEQVGKWCSVEAGNFSG
ncbi:hypothetical protein HF1_13650 [Mycoplasma haemofelis str. Langford 1]|uniref:Uncharacterized protein n=1 Tax=Mycoplasma haemofelis (strain Langford 1) TaxID=941640 RepID=E8ZJQ2_MYCHL|nr:hypothetical protein [Mycoplasma haemofelis]CBY93373.1 hypothetical protein HF1_13650 [Mycoplasma haemofelis str. Langford 1]